MRIAVIGDDVSNAARLLFVLGAEALIFTADDRNADMANVVKNQNPDAVLVIDRGSGFITIPLTQKLQSLAIPTRVLHFIDSFQRAGGEAGEAEKINAAFRELRNDCVASIVGRVRAEGRSIIFTNGCFDLFTAGHSSLLQWAKLQGDFLIVGINTDDSVKRLKGPERPLCPIHHRCAVVSAVRWTDIAIAFDEDTPTDLCKIIKPDVLVKGADYQSRQLPGAEFCKRVALAPFVDGVSTTTLLQRIKGQL